MLHRSLGLRKAPTKRTSLRDAVVHPTNQRCVLSAAESSDRWSDGARLRKSAKGSANGGS